MLPRGHRLILSPYDGKNSDQMLVQMPSAHELELAQRVRLRTIADWAGCSIDPDIWAGTDYVR